MDFQFERERRPIGPVIFRRAVGLRRQINGALAIYLARLCGLVCASFVVLSSFEQTAQTTCQKKVISLKASSNDKKFRIASLKLDFSGFTFLLFLEHFLAFLAAGALLDGFGNCWQVAAELHVKQLAVVVYVGFPFGDALRTNNKTKAAYRLVRTAKSTSRDGGRPQAQEHEGYLPVEELQNELEQLSEQS